MCFGVFQRGGNFGTKIKGICRKPRTSLLYPPPGGAGLAVTTTHICILWLCWEPLLTLNSVLQERYYTDLPLHMQEGTLIMST